jgi:hypothetical protein
MLSAGTRRPGIGSVGEQSKEQWGGRWISEFSILIFSPDDHGTSLA